MLDFKKANNIVDTGGRLIGEQQLAELNSQIVLARAATAEAVPALIASAKSPRMVFLQSRQRDAVAGSRGRRCASQRCHQQAAQRIPGYRQPGGVYAARLGRDHLVVVNLRNQMFEIRKSIFDELKRIEETFKSDYRIALAREQSIQQSLAEAVAQNQSTNQAQISLEGSRQQSPDLSRHP